MKANEKKCPQCAEAIKKDALVCKHCGYKFSNAELQAQKHADSKTTRNGAIGCFGLLGVILLIGMCSSGTNKEVATPSDTAGERASTGVTNSTKAQSAPASNWTYSESKDDMRGTATRLAEVTSDNKVDLEFPYGEVSAHLTVRRDKDGLNIYFNVDKGQVLCHSFTPSYLSVKFDGQTVKRFRCTDTSDGSSETAFFTDERGMLAGLKRSKRVMVEAEFFQQGRRQFTFQTEGLDWR